MRIMRWFGRISIVLAMTLFIIGLYGCGKKEDVVFDLNGSKVDRKSVDAFGLIYVSEHGIADEELFDEVYENGETYAEHYKNELEKDIILSVLLGKEADENKISLDKEDKKKAKDRAGELADKLGKALLNGYDIDADDLRKVYELKYRGNAYASSIGEEIDEDVEEDKDADDTDENEDKDRYIKVFQVIFPTVLYDSSGMVETNDKGELLRVSQNEMDAMRQAAEEFYNRAVEGEDVEKLLEDEEDNVKGSVRVLKYNDLSEDYKNGIDGVKEGGVSKVINGEYGYYVVKILNTDDSGHADFINDYETSKKTNEAKEKLYNKLFDTYVGADKEYRNDEIWNTINITDYEKSE